MEKIEGTSLALEYEGAALLTVGILNEIMSRIEKEEGQNLAAEVTYRIKSSESIEKKLKRKGYDLTLEAASEKLNDIAGVRCICSYLDDLYRLEELLKEHEKIHVIKEKDFIKKPKKGGYRSLHLIIEIPVSQGSRTICRRTEVQFRTQIMHLWAKLDHNSIYKSENKENKKLHKKLKSCAKLGIQMDQLLREIRKGTESEA